MAQTKKNNSKKTWIIRIAAIILLIIGLGMIFNSQIRDIMVRQNQTTALKKLNKETVKKNQKKKGMFDFSKVEEIDFGQVTKSRVNNTADAIGAIAVPSVNMYLPIMKGLSDDAMSTGGGTMRPDQVMGKGNYPLAGERVYLTNLDKIYVYRIYMKKIVDPTAVWLVDNTKENIVTLITCADGGVNRWAIRGKLIAEEPATDKNLQVFKLK